MIKRLIFLLLLIPSLIFGQKVATYNNKVVTYNNKVLTYSDPTKWYFANDGNDGNNGHTPATAKQTFPHLLTLDLGPGHTVFFNKGDTWRIAQNDGDGNLPWIGAEGNHITFTSYGSGAKPRILGSDTIIMWINHSGNIWKGYKASLIPVPAYGSMFFVKLDGSIEWGTSKSSVSAITSPYDCRNSNDTVYVYSTSDPATAFTSVEISQCPEGMLDLRTDQDSAEFYTFDGLELAYGSAYGISTNYPGGSPSGRELSGLWVRNCHIHHLNQRNGAYGFGVFALINDVIIELNDIHDCGRRGFSISPDANFTPDTIYNILIQDNHFHDGWHTTGPDIIISGAHAVTIDSLVIRRNIIDEDTARDMTSYGSTGIFLGNGGNAATKMTRVYIYNNLIKNVSGYGIQMIVSENAASVFDGVYIYNNTLYDVHPDNATTAVLFMLDSTLGAYTNTYIRNNITYISNVGGISPNNVYTFDWQGTGITFDYNLHYNTTGTNAFHWDGNNYTQAQWAAYKAASGRESNSPTPADPLFKDPPTNLKVSSLSDAVGAGIYILGYTHDIDGVPVSNPPNIGAHETTED